MDTTSPGAQRLRGPADLLQAVPYLLGFTPDHSLVLVGLHEGSLIVTARLDLPDAGTDFAADPPLGTTVGALVRAGVTSLVAAVYADPTPGERLPTVELQWSPMATAVHEHAEALGCDVLDVLLVAGGRWRSVGCRDPQCCPPSGRVLPVEPSAFAAAATVAGVVALPNRGALEAVLEPVADPARAAVRRAMEAARADAVRAEREGRSAGHERAVKRAIFAAARGSQAPRWMGCTERDVARFALGLTVRDLRDAVWSAVDDKRLDGRPLWRELARRAPVPFDAAPAFLFGWASWRAGDGASANVAAQRAIDSDPGCTAADLLLAALAHGADPRTFPRVRVRARARPA